MKPTTEPVPGDRFPASARTSQGVREMPLPPALSSGPDAVALLEALRRRWFAAFSLGLVCGALAAAGVYFFLPPEKYTARALLHVATTPPRFVFATTTNTPREGNEFELYKKTQAALIKSRLVLESALRRPGVATSRAIRAQRDPLNWLEQEVQVTHTEGSELLTIAVNGPNASETTNVVNAVTDAYWEEVLGREESLRSAKIDKLQHIYNRFQEQLAGKRATLRKLAQEAGSDDKQVLALKNRFVLQRLDLAQKELSSIQSDLRRARAELRAARTGLEGPFPDPPAPLADEQIRQDRTVRALQQQITELERALAGARRLSRNSSDPSIRKFKGDLEATRAALSAHVQKLRGVLTEQIRAETLSNVSRRVGRLEQEVQVTTDIESIVQKQVDQLAREAKLVNESSLNMQALLEEVGPADTAAKRVGEELEAMRVEQHAAPRVTLVERAKVPRPKDELRQVKMSGGAGAVALLLVVGGVTFVECRARRVSRVEEIVEGLGMSLVGALPALPNRLRERGLRERGLRGDSQDELYWKNLLVESVDTARTVLLRAWPAEGLRAVMVTSAGCGEGKTSLAGHLALSLARAGRRTLLIDCDMRTPAAHALFSQTLEPGFAELLRGETGVDQAARVVFERLWMIPAGRCDTRALEALAQEETRDLFDRLKGRFDFLIVDTPPVLPVADTLLLSEHVDGVIFSVLRGVSRIPKIYAAAKRLSSLGIRVVGTVVTGVDGGESYGNSKQYLMRTELVPENRE